MNEIHNMTKRAKEKEVLSSLENIENAKDDSRKMFKAVKIFNKVGKKNILVDGKEGLNANEEDQVKICLLYTSPSPRDA